MDLTDTVIPNSDQLDACDLLTGPRTFTIKSVSKGNAEQPVNYHLAEFDRPWRPGKSMRRVLIACWGADAAKHVGRRITLFCDPTVKFGGLDVGGTRISHMSHIDKARTIPLLVTRGKSAPFRVQPLVESAASPKPSAAKPEPVSQQQIDWMLGAMNAAKMAERDRLNYVASIIGRPVNDPNGLTSDEAQKVIAALETASTGDELPLGDQ